MSAAKEFEHRVITPEELERIMDLCPVPHVRKDGQDVFSELFRKTGGGVSSEPGFFLTPEQLSEFGGGIGYGILNAAEDGLLPADYQEQIRRLHDEFTQVRPFKVIDQKETDIKKKITRDSSEREMGRIVGKVIKKEMPWFDRLYHGAFLKWARILSGNSHLVTADEIVKSDPENKSLAAEALKKKIAEMSYALNSVNGPKQQLIGHVDTNAVSGIFFPEDYTGPDGRTIFSADPRASTIEQIMATRIMEFVPRAGKMLYVAATQLPHFVESVPEGFLRLSIACNFFDSRVDRKRSPELERNRR